MSPRPSSTTPDLRLRILDAAERLIETEGLTALSMREVARRSGVTHQAPYHHFADREAILAELVVRGFDELAARLAKANDLGPATGRMEAGVAAGLAYVGYAIDHPGVFRVMFRPELCDVTRYPQAQQSGSSAYAELERLVAAIHGQALVASLSMVYWSQVHGLACLIVDGPVGEQLPGSDDRRTFARSVLEPFARQMLAIPSQG
ncbi:TetR/AcrR family transcriptional regulator [Hydrogenophaga sp. MI9]|uniref:TetR/AcrR family transcriptional regulator n=1 Tax=Hydrogenophaga sp. MI9 TaxID=3453719 RepID=UPI003EE999FF